MQPMVIEYFQPSCVANPLVSERSEHHTRGLRDRRRVQVWAFEPSQGVGESGRARSLQDATMANEHLSRQVQPSRSRSQQGASGDPRKESASERRRLCKVQP